MDDGIYFGVEDQDYHKIDRLSSSGIQKILISPATFWVDSWLNPDREVEEDEPQHRATGRAYHCARFEPHKLMERFVSAPNPDGLADLLATDAAVKRALKDVGMTQAMKDESALERARRLQDAGYPGPIWSLMMEDFEAERGDRTAIPPKVWKEIQTDMERLHGNEELAALVSGGASEVVVLWTHEETGIKMKAKLDYLAPAWWVDLKTFQNSMGKQLDRCVADAFRFNRNYIQAGVYDVAVDRIQRGGLEVMGADTDAALRGLALVDEIQNRGEPLACWYLFQEKGGVPNLLAYQIEMTRTEMRPGEAQGSETVEVRVPSVLMMKAQIEIDYAMNQFKRYSEIYAPGEPWAPVDPLRRLSSDDYPGFWLDDVPR